ncbi:hypothetical protein F383_26487 [Gossypium arboreum]|uniref:Uncharacterized protein n=1 Tax=Gossypium arboreum TaxID=29729 RepID=A0A0B0P7L5_GOSAR|nr:hypothetical protein F383_26487 [Gossypium arboreum]
MLYGRVSLGVVNKIKSICSTRSYTRACGWPCGTSKYTL